MSAERRLKSSERPPTARVFFALWPPAEAAAQLADVANGLAAQWGGRPTRAETIHLTLAFLGEVAVAELPALCALARGISGRSFAIRLGHFGYWPKNQLLWAGCAAVPDELVDLQSRLQAALGGKGYRTRPPGQGFTPHVSLVRKMRCAPNEGRISELAMPENLLWPCQHFVLVSSVLTPEGPNYRILEAFPLSA